MSASTAFELWHGGCKAPEQKPRSVAAHTGTHLTALPLCHAPGGPCRDRARAPTVLLLNTDDQQALRHSLPALGELPTAGMPLAGSSTALPALGWQLPAVRGAVQQLLAAGDWLQVRALREGCEGVC